MWKTLLLFLRILRSIRNIEIYKKKVEVEVLTKKLEEAEKEKEAALAEKEKHIVRVQKQQFASNLVHKSIESHLMQKGSGIGYNEVPPPVKSAFAPPGKELSFISELEIGKPVGESSTSDLETPKVEAKKFPEAPIVEKVIHNTSMAVVIAIPKLKGRISSQL